MIKVQSSLEAKRVAAKIMRHARMRPWPLACVRQAGVIGVEAEEAAGRSWVLLGEALVEERLQMQK